MIFKNFYGLFAAVGCLLVKYKIEMLRLEMIKEKERVHMIKKLMEDVLQNERIKIKDLDLTTKNYEEMEK